MQSCMDRALIVQEGRYGLAQEINPYPEAVIGYGMQRKGSEGNDRAGNNGT